MKNIIIDFCFVFFSTNIYSQKIGYEFRSNAKAYLSTSYAGFEVRHRTD